MAVTFHSCGTHHLAHGHICAKVCAEPPERLIAVFGERRKNELPFESFNKFLKEFEQTAGAASASPWPAKEGEMSQQLARAPDEQHYRVSFSLGCCVVLQTFFSPCCRPTIQHSRKGFCTRFVMRTLPERAAQLHIRF